MLVDGQPAAFLIGEADLTAQTRTEHTILFNQIREGLLPLVSPPAGHGHHEKANCDDIHDRGSLPHPLNDDEMPSAGKWDTTGKKRATRADARSAPGESRRISECPS